MRDTVGLGSPVMRAMSRLPITTEPWVKARSTSSPRARPDELAILGSAGVFDVVAHGFGLSG